jgi:hypothetical protein
MDGLLPSGVYDSRGGSQAPPLHPAAAGAAEGVARGVFLLRVAAETSVTIKPTGNTSTKVMPTLKSGFL